MYVTKSSYKCFSEPAVLDKDLVLAEDLNVIKFKIYIIPHTSSIYNIITDISDYANLPMCKDDCFIYIYSDFNLQPDIIRSIEDFIKHNVDDAVLDDSYTNVNFMSAVESPRKAIDLFGNITLHFSHHHTQIPTKNETYHYINYSCRENQHQIDNYCTRVKYVKLDDRHRFSTLNGKVTEGTTVLLFNAYPMESNIVYIIPDEFNIIQGSNNKIASFESNNFIFWIVTHHTFLNDKPVSGEINTTRFCPQQQSIENMETIFETFSKYSFDNPQITKSAVIAKDENCSMLMFVGIYNMQYGNEYSKYFEKLGTQ